MKTHFSSSFHANLEGPEIIIFLFRTFIPPKHIHVFLQYYFWTHETWRQCANTHVQSHTHLGRWNFACMAALHLCFLAVGMVARLQVVQVFGGDLTLGKANWPQEALICHETATAHTHASSFNIYDTQISFSVHLSLFPLTRRHKVLFLDWQEGSWEQQNIAAQVKANSSTSVSCIRLKTHKDFPKIFRQ